MEFAKSGKRSSNCEKGDQHSSESWVVGVSGWPVWKKGGRRNPECKDSAMVEKTGPVLHVGNVWIDNEANSTPNFSISIFVPKNLA